MDGRALMGDLQMQEIVMIPGIQVFRAA